jgi:ABC-type transport system substrate-binding protein
LIEEQVTYGYGTAAWSPFSPKWSNPDVRTYEYDLDAANQLLDDAGYERGGDGMRFSLRFSYDVTRGHIAKISEIVIENLRQIGINVIPEPGDRASSYEQQWLQHDFDFSLAGGYPGTGPDPNIGIARFLLSDNIGDAYWNNGAAYENERVDELFELAAAETDEEMRRQYFYEIEDIITDELPYIWYLWGGNTIIWRDEFTNFDWFDTTQQMLHTVFWTRGEPLIPEEPPGPPQELIDRVDDLEDDVGSLSDDISDLSAQLEDLQTSQSNNFMTAIAVAVVAIIIAIAAAVLSRRRG